MQFSFLGFSIFLIGLWMLFHFIHFSVFHQLMLTTYNSQFLAYVRALSDVWLLLPMALTDLAHLWLDR
jgi:hypothetical protein